ncbi:acyl-CoA dehydrogenase family protein [Bacillus shivajii]|uniref:acyl-CoA dehydrogenase family protein n=1 Tax=Bacillus shivajii TaxID=1983719 RepID=UPI001CFBD374|nr:acyl-CoA dehydrogenase family protein [Bacillus shivajii]UCZ54244.1 acyl-CoA dehydrogenase family protein [Bacillus shivajii]
MNFYKTDEQLKEILKKQFDAGFFAWADKELEQFGYECATTIDERARHTDREGEPKLVKYDRFGNDQSHVWLNEGYRKTRDYTYGKGIVGYVHKEIPELQRKGDYVYSFAQGYLLSQTEPGFYCPVTLTMATAYLLENYADKTLKETYLPHVLSTGEHELYEGATFLTERQGGSDVGANETKAVYENGSYKLYGEKYFASNGGACGVATVLARTEGAQEGTRGLSLFLVPWRNEDGSLNGLSIRRLKDKLGVRAVPSAEVTFEGAEAYMIGEKERGFYYMMEALNLSRICNAVASVGIMRRAYTESLNYANDRDAFGKKLIEYPMIQDTLVKMKVKQEVETAAVFELGQLFDRWTKGETTKLDDSLLRLHIALLKAESAEQAIHFSHEAIEMHGGNGYIEDFVTPRLLRDAQVLTVWEGTANILGLEIIRLMKKFKVDSVFISQLYSELDHIPNTFTDKKKVLYEIISELNQELEAYKTSDSISQTRIVKQLSKKMVTTLEAVIALNLLAESKTERQEEVFNIYTQNELLPLFQKETKGWTLDDGKIILGEKIAQL